MSDTKWTQGLWTLHADPCHYDTLSSVRSGETPVAEVCGETWVDQEANAYLIAAAPELYEALSEIVEFIDREGPPAKEWLAISNACERADKTLRKARGESK